MKRLLGADLDRDSLPRHAIFFSEAVNLFINPLCIIPQGVVRPKQKRGAPPEDRNLQGPMLLRNNLMELRPAVLPFSHNGRTIIPRATRFIGSRCRCRCRCNCTWCGLGYSANSLGELEPNFTLAERIPRISTASFRGPDERAINRGWTIVERIAIIKARNS